jgi:Protein of unknown function (DUF4054)
LALTATPATLRQGFPEFKNVQQYPDELIQYWLNWAYLLLNKGRWGKMYDNAATLFAAHNIVEEARAMREAGKGIIPGYATGAVSSKSVDKVAVSYDTALVSEKDAGDWNQTIYGRRLYRLIRMFGAGPVQVGVGYVPPWVLGLDGSGAWPGPPPWPGWFGS